WFVFPHFSDWGKVKTRMEKAKRDLKKEQDEVAQLPIYQKKLKEVQSEGLDVPAEDQTAQFSRTIQGQQAATGVTLANVGRATSHTNQFFVEQTETITVQSTEQQLVDFLYNLGSSNSMIRIRDLTLRPDS